MAYTTRRCTSRGCSIHVFDAVLVVQLQESHWQILIMTNVVIQVRRMQLALVRTGVACGSSRAERVLDAC